MKIQIFNNFKNTGCKSLFKWSKDGIIYKHMNINLTKEYEKDKDSVIDFLYNLLYECEYIYHKNNIKEVIDQLREI